MPVATIQALSVAANAKSAEQLQGTQLAFAPKDGMLSLYVAASAAGINVTAIYGSEVVIDDQPCSAANRFPVRPDDLLYAAGVAKGEQLRLFFRNTTAGALTVNAIAELL